jgi:hypothetical protein
VCAHRLTHTHMKTKSSRRFRNHLVNILKVENMTKKIGGGPYGPEVQVTVIVVFATVVVAVMVVLATVSVTVVLANVVVRFSVIVVFVPG